jgi:hypothetical protein
MRNRVREHAPSDRGGMAARPSMELVALAAIGRPSRRESA